MYMAEIVAVLRAQGVINPAPARIHYAELVGGIPPVTRDYNNRRTYETLHVHAIIACFDKQAAKRALEVPKTERHRAERLRLVKKRAAMHAARRADIANGIKKSHHKQPA